MQPDTVQLWSLLCLAVIAVLGIAFIVAQLANTRGGLRIFHVLFPPRRQRTIPWGISAIAPVLLVFVLLMSLSSEFVKMVFPEPFNFLRDNNAVVEIVAVEHLAVENEAANHDIDPKVAQPFTEKELPEQHPLVILMQKSGRNILVILACFLMAVVVAPLAEEFLFRIVIQGGIESTLRREFGRSVWAVRLPILVTAAFFAAIHFRSPTEPDSDHLLKMMVVNMMGYLTTMAVVIVVFRGFYRIRWSDIGLWDFRRIGRDALGAFLLLLVIIIPVNIVSFTARTFAQTEWAVAHGISGSMVDPIPLFLLAMVLGTLYYRTRRFSSVVFLHAFFNLYSFLILMYLTFGAD
jgi:membrane protease YdiL (CAAX protease family)